jgi:drug/metabolite transporter (DMT)-like permease
MSNRQTFNPFRHSQRKSPPAPLALVPVRFFPAPDLIQGALLVVSAELMFASMGVAIRIVAQEMPNAGIVFFRNLIGMSILLPLLLPSGWSGLRTSVPHLHLLRGMAGLAAMYCFFYAIAHMPLAEAMLLKLSAPMFIPVVALLWLGEQVPWRVRWAIVLGLVGVVLILRPDLGAMAPIGLIALLGGVFAAIAKVTVRRLSRTEPTTRIVFYFALIGTLVSALPLFRFWQTPSPQAMSWLLAVGLFATLGQLLLTRGFALAPAARMGTFGFFSVLFGALYGWLFWDELLGWSTIIGATLVILAGVNASRGHGADRASVRLVADHGPRR